MSRGKGNWQKQIRGLEKLCYSFLRESQDAQLELRLRSDHEESPRLRGSMLRPSRPLQGVSYHNANVIYYALRRHQTSRLHPLLAEPVCHLDDWCGRRVMARISPFSDSGVRGEAGSQRGARSYDIAKRLRCPHKGSLKEPFECNRGRAGYGAIQSFHLGSWIQSHRPGVTFNHQTVTTPRTRRAVIDQ